MKERGFEFCYLQKRKFSLLNIINMIDFPLNLVETCIVSSIYAITIPAYSVLVFASFKNPKSFLIKVLSVLVLIS